MKQLIAILLSSIVLFLNIGIRLTNHYCEGELRETAITISSEELECDMMVKNMTGCGMEGMTSSCEAPTEGTSGFHNDCCENEYLPLTTDDNYEKQNVENLKVNYKFFTAFIISYVNLYSTNNLNSKEYLVYSPPLLEQDISILNQSFLL